MLQQIDLLDRIITISAAYVNHFQVHRKYRFNDFCCLLKNENCHLQSYDYSPDYWLTNRSQYFLWFLKMYVMNVITSKKFVWQNVGNIGLMSRRLHCTLQIVNKLFSPFLIRVINTFVVYFKFDCANFHHKKYYIKRYLRSFRWKVHYITWISAWKNV